MAGSPPDPGTSAGLLPSLESSVKHGSGPPISPRLPPPRSPHRPFFESRMDIFAAQGCDYFKARQQVRRDKEDGNSPTPCPGCGSEAPQRAVRSVSMSVDIETRQTLLRPVSWKARLRACPTQHKANTIGLCAYAFPTTTRKSEAPISSIVLTRLSEYWLEVPLRSGERRSLECVRHPAALRSTVTVRCAQGATAIPAHCPLAGAAHRRCSGLIFPIARLRRVC